MQCKKKQGEGKGSGDWLTCDAIWGRVRWDVMDNIQPDADDHTVP